MPNIEMISINRHHNGSTIYSCKGLLYICTYNKVFKLGKGFMLKAHVHFSRFSSPFSCRCSMYRIICTPYIYRWNLNSHLTLSAEQINHLEHIYYGCPFPEILRRCTHDRSIDHFWQKRLTHIQKAKTIDQTIFELIKQCHLRCLTNKYKMAVQDHLSQ